MKQGKNVRSCSTTHTTMADDVLILRELCLPGDVDPNNIATMREEMKFNDDDDDQLMIITRQYIEYKTMWRTICRTEYLAALITQGREAVGQADVEEHHSHLLVFVERYACKCAIARSRKIRAQISLLN
jgi:hypothetical protein